MPSRRAIVGFAVWLGCLVPQCAICQAPSNLFCQNYTFAASGASCSSNCVPEGVNPIAGSSGAGYYDAIEVSTDEVCVLRPGQEGTCTVTTGTPYEQEPDAGCCEQPGSTCGDNDPCCNGNPSCSDGFCPAGTPTTPICTPVGNSGCVAGTLTDCCSGSCVSGTCLADTACGGPTDPDCPTAVCVTSSGTWDESSCNNNNCTSDSQCEDLGGNCMCNGTCGSSGGIGASCDMSCGGQDCEGQLDCIDNSCGCDGSPECSQSVCDVQNGQWDDSACDNNPNDPGGGCFERAGTELPLCG